MKKKLAVMIVTTAAVCIGMTSCGKGDSSDNTISLPPNYDWSTNVQTFTVTDKNKTETTGEVTAKDYTDEEIEAYNKLQNDPNSDANIAVYKLNQIINTDEFQRKTREEKEETIMSELQSYANQSDKAGKLNSELIAYDYYTGEYTFIGIDGSRGAVSIGELDTKTNYDINDESSNNTSDGGWVR